MSQYEIPMSQMSGSAPDRMGWRFHHRAPDDWQRSLEHHGGGYFHSPIGIDAVAAPGQAVFLEWRCCSTTVGIAAAILHSCRVSGAPRHVYLPTPPVVRQWLKPESGLRSLMVLRLTRSTSFAIAGTIFFASSVLPQMEACCP